jgi:hypothetical protein
MISEQINGIEAELGVYHRHHSAQLITATHAWTKSIPWDSITDLTLFRKPWSEQLQDIGAEASYLGFSRTITMCRHLHAAINKSSVPSTILHPDQTQILQHALAMLSQLVASPRCISLRSLGELTDSIRLEFQLSDDDLATLLNGEMKSTSSDLTSRKTEAPAQLEHRDMGVYRNSRLDSLDQCLEEESWIVLQLASLAEDLASGIHSNHPAGRLMHVLRNHKFFNQVDRVCLAGRIADSNQLVVVDASLSDRCPENSLKKGYSCFVNPEGSLFKMKPGTVRIFADCERVLACFAEQGKPAQRSIALISDQGLRSGLCLAIGRGTEIQGFLFMNSLQPDLFRNITTSSAPLLSLFGLVATIGLDISGFHLSPNSGKLLEGLIPKTSTIFNSRHFAILLERALNLWYGPGRQCLVNVPRDYDSHQFLYLPTVVIGTLAELLFRTHRGVLPNVQFDLEIQTSKDSVVIQFPHGCNPGDSACWNWITGLVQVTNSKFLNKPLRVRITNSHIAVEFPFEPLLTGHKELLYSVVY